MINFHYSPLPEIFSGAASQVARIKTRVILTKTNAHCIKDIQITMLRTAENPF